MPCFGPAAIREMFDGMADVASQLLLKWERFGPENIIDPTDDFTRLALDTIALCTMSYRLNSFYGEGQPPFGTAMADFLKECFARANRPSIVQALMPGASAKYAENIAYMKGLADKSGCCGSSLKNLDFVLILGLCRQLWPRGKPTLSRRRIC